MRDARVSGGFGAGLRAGTAVGKVSSFMHALVYSVHLVHHMIICNLNPIYYLFIIHYPLFIHLVHHMIICNPNLIRITRKLETVGLKIWWLRVRVEDWGFRVQGSGFRVKIRLGLRVEG